MKVAKYLQFQGEEINIESLEKKIKAIWKDAGKLQKDIKTLKIYIKPEESTCYYVINDSEKGNFSMN
ncbi:DUF6465 family protein [Clostridium magnum]|uniref:Uncharacterized protein n=1 Tax=Clostridium magnum DSM 2767 TaxID=1121326 RepID=A0A162QCN0_9CLOT|nr:DUF6465 family protein [Clostridium magnum]KZL88393.1 hypothetical protein CLMAG_63200 [Clostridium magnum DSM 2767]SHJ46697.1 hypothetical protein SAMN02745944_06014 [Clostridium magnum DSM 2767]